MNKQIDSLIDYLVRQLATFFPDNSDTLDIRSIVAKSAPSAFNLTSLCLQSVKTWSNDKFNHLISGQYSIFLYFLSKNVWIDSESKVVATKLFLLNKALNGIDLYYEVDMPNYFLVGHTVGMVFSKATYSNYIVFHQGCTVGRIGDDRPTLEEGVILYPNSSIIGRCHVRENTVLAPGVQLVNQDTPGNCYVFSGGKGRPVFKEIDEFFADRYFDREVKPVAIKGQVS